MNNECSSFGGCSAPLCPIDSSGDRGATWFADEPLCRKRSPPRWVRTQKKIAKLRLGPKAGCWTVATLSEIKAVRRGIRGLQPESLNGHSKNTAAFNCYPVETPMAKVQTPIEADKQSSSLLKFSAQGTLALA